MPSDSILTEQAIRIAELEAEVKRLTSINADYIKANADLANRYLKLIESHGDVVDVAKKLAEYAEHEMQCGQSVFSDEPAVCSCGLETVLADFDALVKATEGRDEMDRTGNGAAVPRSD